jgi:hypothetical protein
MCFLRVLWIIFCRIASYALNSEQPIGSYDRFPAFCGKTLWSWFNPCNVRLNRDLDNHALFDRASDTLRAKARSLYQKQFWPKSRSKESTRLVLINLATSLREFVTNRSYFICLLTTSFNLRVSIMSPLSSASVSPTILVMTMRVVDSWTNKYI